MFVLAHFTALWTLSIGLGVPRAIDVSSDGKHVASSFLCVDAGVMTVLPHTLVHSTSQWPPAQVYNQREYPAAYRQQNTIISSTGLETLAKYSQPLTCENVRVSIHVY